MTESTEMTKITEMTEITQINNMQPGNQSFSRRDLLRSGALGLSALSLAPLLAACSGSGSGSNKTLGPDTQLVQRWVPDQLTPGPVRLPISLADSSGLMSTGPDVLNAKIIRYLDNAVVADGLVAEKLSLGEGTPAFWVFTATLEDQDVYALIVDGGPEDGASLQIRDPQFLTVPRVGQTLPPLDTPTVDDPRGVEVICTRVPEPCPFHEVTLGQALGNPNRTAFLVGTPAHCQTGVCAPILENLIEISDQYPDVTFIHADVYADVAATTVAPVVQALTLTFEPVLWITDSTGMITHRFEGVWHPSEVIRALEF